MSLTPTIYQSTDAGAPQLSGTVGSLISVLRAVLVTGYGTAPNNKPGLGWSEEFSGANLAAFRNDPVQGSGYFVRVQDDGTAGSGGDARSASLKLFRSMGSIDGGEGVAPTVDQMANGAIWPKSSTASATGRSWWAFGTSTYLYLMIDHASSGAPQAFFFGDLARLFPEDVGCCLLSVRNPSYAGSTNPETNLFSFSSQTTEGWDRAISLSTACGVLGTDLAGFNNSVMVRHQAASNAKAAGGLFGSSMMGGKAYPQGASARFLYEPAVVLEVGAPRGVMPDVVVPLHNAGLADGVLIGGVDELPGKAILIKQYRSWPGQFTGISSTYGFIGFVVPVP